MLEDKVKRLEAQVLRLESYINILRRELSVQGNLIVGDTPYPDGLTVGANATLLTADSTQPLGIKWEAPASSSAITEAAQDAVGTILLDSSTINFTYDDATPTITGIVIDDSITFAKMQEIATDRLLGRDTASTGNPEELTVGGGLEFTGSAGIQRSALTGDVTASAGSAVTTIANDAVTNAKLRNSGALSVIGRSVNSAGDPADISATAATDTVLIEDGGTLTFGQVKTDGIADEAVTNAKLRVSTALSVIGQALNSIAAPADITAVAASGAVLRESGSTLSFGTIATAGIAANAVTNAKLAQMVQSTVKGRAVGAGTGDPTDLTVSQLNTLVGSADLTMADTFFVAADKVRARDSGGLRLEDDAGTLGLFVEDSTGYVGVGTNDPVYAFHIKGGHGTTFALTNPTDSDRGFACINNSGDVTFGSNSSIRDFIITTDSTEAIFLAAATQRVRMGGSGAPNGRLEVSQNSTTAAIPTLELEQADLSEEFINFVTTIGVGNPTEAVGAKVLTTTHFIRIQIDGVGYRYIPVGTIA
jgi:hypothetical protein